MPASGRVRVGRKPERGRYDRETIEAILDAAIVGHVGYVVEGQPYVTPTAVWREGDRLLWHGSSASRGIRVAREGSPVCVTVTHVDALILARSGFDHSMDYRSVMVLGTAHEISEPAEKLRSLESFMEHLFPGRWATLRPPTPRELKATSVLWVALDESSAKVRDLGPNEDPGDDPWPAWAGSIPIRVVAGSPLADAFVQDGLDPPALSPMLGLEAAEGR
jgi:uncharacterized protein